MKELIGSIRLYLHLSISALSGLLSLWLLRNDVFKDVSQELIAIFGLLMAGVLPTMILTASIIRAGQLSVKSLKAYQTALGRQLKVWIGLFLISFSASLLIVFGKLIDWSLPIHVPLAFFGLGDVSFDIVRLVNALIVMALTLMLSRVIDVGNGIISILNFSAELAIMDAQARDDARHKFADESIMGMVERKGFGELVEFPKQ